VDADQLTAADPAQELSDSIKNNSEIEVDDLILQATVTSRWPLSNRESLDDKLDDGWEEESSQTLLSAHKADDATHPSSAIRYDDETDEMDALPNPPLDQP